MSELQKRPAKRVVPVVGNTDLVQGISGLLRVAATTSWRTVNRTLGATVRAGRTAVERTLDGERPVEVLQETTAELREFAWRTLGLDELNTSSSKQPRGGTMTGLLGSFGAFGPPAQTNGDDEVPTAATLRARGQELLNRSADVDVDEEGHPAYARILSEITPDEARILRFLYREGPQPAIDVRTNRPFGIGSELVASGLNMIGEHAGLRHLDRIQPYLINLSRLGLIEFSKETVRNPNRYQVVEAQPRVLEAMKQAGRAPKIVRRSVLLNAFGREFCKVCLFGDEQPTTIG